MLVRFRNPIEMKFGLSNLSRRDLFVVMAKLHVHLQKRVPQRNKIVEQGQSIDLALIMQ